MIWSLIWCWCSIFQLTVVMHSVSLSMDSFVWCVLMLLLFQYHPVIGNPLILMISCERVHCAILQLPLSYLLSKIWKYYHFHRQFSFVRLISKYGYKLFRKHLIHGYLFHSTVSCPLCLFVIVRDRCVYSIRKYWWKCFAPAKSKQTFCT